MPTQSKYGSTTSVDIYNFQVGTKYMSIFMPFNIKKNPNKGYDQLQLHNFFMQFQFFYKKMFYVRPHQFQNINVGPESTI